MIVSDNTIAAEGLDDFPKNPGREGLNAFAFENPILALSSLPELIKFYHTVKRLYLEKFVRAFILINTKPAEKLHPYVPLESENHDFEERLEKN